MATEPSNEIRSIRDLVMSIRKRGPMGIVGIEGVCGSGKTYLGKQLAAQLNACLVSTDCFVALQDEDTYYVDRLNLDELARVITNALRLRQSMILEGICLRDIISQVLPRSVVLFIYVKALSGEGIWHGGAWFKDYEPFGPEPDFSDHRYHKKSQPHGRADFIYVRQEG